jgi:hypothetical protein
MKVIVVRDAMSDEIFGVYTSYKCAVRSLIRNERFPFRMLVVNNKDFFRSEMKNIEDIFGKDWKETFVAKSEEESRALLRNNDFKFWIDEVKVDG